MFIFSSEMDLTTGAVMFVTARRATAPRRKKVPILWLVAAMMSDYYVSCLAAVSEAEFEYDPTGLGVIDSGDVRWVVSSVNG